MFKLIAAAAAVMFAVLYVFGAEERRVEISRLSTTDDAAGLSLAAFNAVKIESTRLPSKSFGVSEEEAVHIALQAGADIRSGRTSKPLYGVVAAVDAAGIAAASSTTEFQEANAPMWYVTGSRVNLRAGPGTSNAVVGKLGFGAEAEVLGDKDGWYEIRTADGVTSGWIFGKFLADSRPG
ncbi:MAG: SH3 domain-containing protein [Paracoccaceae bacterium]